MAILPSNQNYLDMKRIFTLLQKLLVLLMVPGFGWAQNNTDYTIRLHSGNFIPKENIATISKFSHELGRSHFNMKYYVTIQFKTLTTDTEKQQLLAAGIHLIDYIPNYAFTAAINDNFNVDQLKSFPVRSIFGF